MIQRIVFALLCCFLTGGMLKAQDVCVIEGTLLKDSLRFTPQRINKLYLSALDEYDRTVVVDSAVLSKPSKKGLPRSFKFTRKVGKDEPALLYFITGFDNGSVQLFVEPGTVKVNIKNGAFPTETPASGTVTNDLYQEYKAIANRCTAVQLDSLKAIEQRNGKQWLDTPEGMEYWIRVGAGAVVDCNADRLQFLLRHNDSPIAPLMMEREIYYMYDKEYADNLLNSISPVLHSHPYYRSFSNLVKSLDLKTGSELPDITLPLADGTRTTLSAFRGKYVLLDFWASWCGPCRKEIPHLVSLFNDTESLRDKFAIISFSLDDKDKAWRDAIKTLGMDKQGWVHACDLLGWGSPAAKQMGVEAVPKAILIDPEGRAISFSLRGEELVRRVKQILGGDLYYQNVGDDKDDAAKRKAIENMDKK